MTIHMIHLKFKARKCGYVRCIGSYNYDAKDVRPTQSMHFWDLQVLSTPTANYSRHSTLHGFVQLSRKRGQALTRTKSQPAAQREATCCRNRTSKHSAQASSDNAACLAIQRSKFCADFERDTVDVHLQKMVRH